MAEFSWTNFLGWLLICETANTKPNEEVKAYTVFDAVCVHVCACQLSLFQAAD